jgi:hypothetical protein
VLEEAGFGLCHTVDGATEHHLDGRRVVERVFEAFDLSDVGFVGAHPAADAGVEVVEVFDDESAAGVVAVRSDEVEGKDESVSEVGEMFAKPSRCGEREVRMTVPLELTKALVGLRCRSRRTRMA